jgi:hypothetical protein
MVMSPVGLGTKNHCAGEAHQPTGKYAVSYMLMLTILDKREQEQLFLIKAANIAQIVI